MPVATASAYPASESGPGQRAADAHISDTRTRSSD